MLLIHFAPVSMATTNNAVKEHEDMISYIDTYTDTPCPTHAHSFVFCTINQCQNLFNCRLPPVVSKEVQLLKPV